MVLGFAADAQALDWRFVPSVGASATYSDNANQSSSNPENELSLAVTPAFTLTSSGSRRVQASMTYGLSAVTRFGEDNSNDIFHRLGALGKAELVEDFLFIDGSASVAQNLVSLFGSPADASVNDSNRATASVYSLSPHLVKRLGSFATARARYTTGGAIFDGGAAGSISNSVTHSFTAGLNSGSRFNDLSWAIDYSIRQANNRGATRDSTFERATLSLGYALSRKFRVFATYGEDRNDFLSATDTEGSSYSVGFGWTPNRRTSIEASAGERYFGRTFSLSGAYRTRASNWTVRYYEDVSDVSQQLQNQSGRIFWVCGGRLFETADFTPPPGQTSCSSPLPGTLISQFYTQLGLTLADLTPFGLGDASLNNGVFIIKSLNAGWSWRLGPRTSVGVSVFDTRRLYQAVNDAEDTTQGISGTVSYRLTPRTAANANLGYTRNSATSAQLGTPTRRDDDTASLNLGVFHQFGKDLSGALNYRHQQRDSNIANADFTENSLSASMNMRF